MIIPGQALLPGVFTFHQLRARPFQDYFSSYETGQSIGRAKTGDLREKKKKKKKRQNLACLTCAPCGTQTRGSNPHQTQRLDDRMVTCRCCNEISALLTTRPQGTAPVTCIFIYSGHIIII